MTGEISTPIPSPSMKGMIGLSGTFRERSALTVILSPLAGTWIFWYPICDSVVVVNEEPGGLFRVVTIRHWWGRIVVVFLHKVTHFIVATSIIRLFQGISHGANSKNVVRLHFALQAPHTASWLVFSANPIAIEMMPEDFTTDAVYGTLSPLIGSHACV